MKAFIEKHPLLLIIPCAWAASIVGINQYQFGMWNQYISIPWLQDLLQPQLFPHDFLVAQSENSPTVFLIALKALFPYFKSLPYLFLTVYLIFHLFLFYSFYSLSFSIFKNTRTTILAIVTLSFAFPVLGDIHLWSTTLMERTVALPLLLLSISAQLRKKFWWAVFLQGVAFNIHPLSGLFVVCISWSGVIVAQGFKKSYWGYGVIFLIIAIPVLYLKFSLTPTVVTPLQEALWLKVMYLRNAHHAFPSAYPWTIVAKSLGITLVFAVMLGTLRLHPYLKKYFLGFALGLGILLLVGLVFTEFYPVKLVLQLQFFRAYRFLIYLSLVLWAGGLVLQPKPIYYALAPLVFWQYFASDLGKGLAAVALITLAWFWFKNKASIRQVVLLAGLYLVLGLVAFTQRDSQAYFKGLQSESWYSLQDWFAQNTSAESLVIVPPHQLGFRVYSQRSSYGDWYDGTKAFFSEAYAEHWWQHMSNLNCTNPDSLVQDYQKNTALTFRRIAREEHHKYAEIYVIQYDSIALNLPEVMHQPPYRVYQITDF